MTTERERPFRIHATYDESIARLLDVFERVNRDVPLDGLRFIIDHQVQHRGHWFYVDHRDIESKRTLGLLTSLIRLSISAGGAQSVPILTLPVSQ